MKNKYVFVAVMLCAILVIGMGFTNIYVNYSDDEAGEEEFSIVTSFYPMYIAALNVVGDIDGVSLSNLSEPQTGCLHDFQMTPEDMKLLGTADLFVINGGGIESFMEDVAASYPELTIVEACTDIELLSEEEEDEEDEQEDEHDHEVNAHAWMSVSLYRQMVQTIAGGLGEADPVHSQAYLDNAAVYDQKLASLQERQSAVAEAAAGQKVILFHEAYDYVAGDYGMEVCYVLDLDEERQVSAGEVADVLAAIQEDGVSLILAEELYGSKMAQTVQQETDVDVIYLDPLNRGDYDADSYLTGMESNIELLEEYYALDEP